MESDHNPPIQVVLLKDGTLKVSDEYYKEILNSAFEVGGWALVPCSEMKELDLSEKGDSKLILIFSLNPQGISQQLP